MPCPFPYTVRAKQSRVSAVVKPLRHNKDAKNVCMPAIRIRNASPYRTAPSMQVCSRIQSGNVLYFRP